MSVHNVTTDADLATHYRTYISLLNSASWSELREFYLAPKIIHTGRELDPQGYCNLVYPHTIFTVDDLLVDVEQKKVASRLGITIGQTPGPVRQCRELVWYEFDQSWKICRAWSMVEEYLDGKWGALER